MSNTAKNNNSDKQIAMKVSTNSIIVNVLLSGFKFFASIIANSSAMISDAVHSASDVFSTIIVMVGVHISSKEADDEHQYGHERFECVARYNSCLYIICYRDRNRYIGNKKNY